MRAGLTGGIASGKTTVARMFEELGARIADADVLARQVLDEPSIQFAIREHFGPSVLEEDSRISRSALGRCIFSSPEERAWLNTLMHPRIRRLLDRELERLEAAGFSGLVLADVPLLLESDAPGRYGPVILVYCPAELQLERLMKRDGSDAEEAASRLSAQMPMEEKRERADYIIDNGGSIARTRRQVRTLYGRLAGRQ